MVETTPWHPFYTDAGWEDAGDLDPGDQILSLDGDYGVVDSVVIVDETQTMYDLDVETVDTFAVGDGAWVVRVLGWVIKGRVGEWVEIVGDLLPRGEVCDMLLLPLSIRGC